LFSSLARSCPATSCLMVFQVLNAAWHVCLRWPDDRNPMQLVTLACFNLISPYLPTSSCPSVTIDNIPPAALQACKILIQFADVYHAADFCDSTSRSIDTSRSIEPSLLLMVRFVLAVRNGDGISALSHARSLLLPSSRSGCTTEVDRFRCYDCVRCICLASNMTSELCDLLSELLEACSSSGLIIGQDLFEHAFSSCLDCTRFVGAGSALHLLQEPAKFSGQMQLSGCDTFCLRILKRAVFLCRFEVLCDGFLAKVPLRHSL
jgi:hypothetical protein